MIVCFKCSRDTKQLMDELVSKGDYYDYAELITSAVHNLVLLDGKMGEEGAVVVNSPMITSKSVKSEKAAISNKQTGIPDLFLPPHKESLQAFSSPLEKSAFDEGVPANQWIFGQYNKLLPLKATCRALANIGRPVAIKDISEMIANDAGTLGDYLRTLDAQRGIKRDGALSTAFPTRLGKDAYKGISRFSNQFVAQINSEGRISGLPYEYKLINVSKEKEIFLTKEGIAFSKLENDVLDKGETEGALSEAEKQYLLMHIKNNLPREAFAFKTITRFIDEKFTSPTQLDQKIKELNPRIGDKEITDEFVSTQRAGVISRMVDLGLVARVKDGVKVNYQLTKYLNSF